MFFRQAVASEQTQNMTAITARMDLLSEVTAINPKLTPLYQRDPKNSTVISNNAYLKSEHARPETPGGTFKLPFGAQCPAGALAEPGAQLSPVTGSSVALYFMAESH